MKITLTDYLAGFDRATNAVELEAAIQAPYKHGFHGRTWTRICRTRIEAGQTLCDASPLGGYVPKLVGRDLVVCDERYRVGRGQNSTGVRYAWTSAEHFAIEVLKRNGLSQRAAHAVWDQWGSYPHRCLKTVEKALQGGYKDPPMDELILGSETGRPINYSHEQNDADDLDRRASRPCPSCEGSLFDWGSGDSSGFTFVSWHCNGCGNVYTEYMTYARLRELRRPAPAIGTQPLPENGTLQRP